MATKNESKVTRRDVIAKACSLDVWNAEEMEVLTKMLASLEKPRKAPEGPTKAQLQNANLANALCEAMAKHGEPVDAKWIAENVPGIMTSQKAVAVVHSAGERITKFYEARKAYYRLNG